MLRGGEWIPVTAARVLIGIFFCISGGTKLFVTSPVRRAGADFGPITTSRSRAQMLSSSPWSNLRAGRAWALRLLTPLCAAMLMGDMIVAIATNRIHSIQASGVLAWLDEFLYLPKSYTR